MRAIARNNCYLWTLNKSNLSRMNDEEPQLCILIQHILLKSMALSAAVAMNSMQSDTNDNLLFE
jgi:hypothetical protein